MSHQGHLNVFRENLIKKIEKASFANDKHQIYDEYFSNCDFSVEMLSRHYKIAKARLGMSVTTQSGSGRQFVAGP